MEPLGDAFSSPDVATFSGPIEPDALRSPVVATFSGDLERDIFGSPDVATCPLIRMMGYV